MALVPQVLWAQRPDTLFLTIALADVKDEVITLDENKLTFKGKADGKEYALEVEFFKAVIPAESKQSVSPRFIVFVVKKAESGPYWPRLLKDTKKVHWLKTDFAKWKDEDEVDEDEPTEEVPGMGGMDFSNFAGGLGGGAGGFGGFDPSSLGGLGGMGGGFGGANGDDEDDDDMPNLESTEEKKDEDTNID